MGLFNKHKSDSERAMLLGDAAIAQLDSVEKATFKLAWYKGDVLKTKQECQAFFDELGNKAVLSLQVHAGIQQVLGVALPSWVPLVPPYQIIPNQDGTVTIGDPV